MTMGTTTKNSKLQELLNPTDRFLPRHIGAEEAEIKEMLTEIGFASLDEMSQAIVPPSIQIEKSLDLPSPLTESQTLDRLRELGAKNKLFKSYIGCGYQASLTPSAIRRNILENPGWYTAYTPYQPEISQGRLEALLNFQTMLLDLTKMEISNASLLDESSAAAEAMTMAWNLRGNSLGETFFVSQYCHPQTIDVVKTRAKPFGIEVEVGDHKELQPNSRYFGALLQYPTTDGKVEDYETLIAGLHENGSLAIVAADLLSLTILRAPGEFGADIVVGSSQRFGLPLGYGGPHAGFIATKDQFKRTMPGRLVGVSIDKQGNPALRLALQTREQHIRRDKATSNICTAQVLLAVISSMYAVYHGPKGLRKIASRIHNLALLLRNGIQAAGYSVEQGTIFDTIKVLTDPSKQTEILKTAEKKEINLRKYADGSIGIALDETVTGKDVVNLLSVFGLERQESELEDLIPESDEIPEIHKRTSEFLTHPIFQTHHTETELMRYIQKLQAKDISLVHSMIPLGSCTMKLNAATEMLAITWPEWSSIHPFVPKEQAGGYAHIFRELESWLSEITGFDATSLQPNAGSQGEYAGLLAIRSYHEKNGNSERNVCLIPTSAHGTNPASAVMAGFKVVVVACDKDGNIDVEDLKKKAEQNSDKLAALMITYPSTHGVFETNVKDVCAIIHENGGQVYMDGANMNAQVGLCRPGDIGADVCHLNLHKTFCIPHGGGGPGVGPICVKEHLKEFLPGHPLVDNDTGNEHGAVTAAPWGSANILLISWAYIAMLGANGLKTATQMAILNANYIAHRMGGIFPVLYKGKNGRVAHECILDLRPAKKESGVEVEDVAKRLIDFGFHAPTMSWPVPGTLMVEPTESESKEELDRFCDSLIKIQSEIEEIAKGNMDAKDNALKNAPHTGAMIAGNDWNHPYSREEAVYPLEWVKTYKYWPPVGRVDNVYGDRNLVCSCILPEEFTSAE